MTWKDQRNLEYELNCAMKNGATIGKHSDAAGVPCRPCLLDYCSYLPAAAVTLVVKDTRLSLSGESPSYDSG